LFCSLLQTEEFWRNKRHWFFIW